LIQELKLSKQAADEVLNDLGINDPILDIARALEQEALNDPYFVERKLYPNVDFYSGIIYRAMGIPVEMFTVMFALRTSSRLDCTMERNEIAKRANWASTSNLYRRKLQRIYPNRKKINNSIFLNKKLHIL